MKAISVQEKEWQIEDDLRALQRAEEIKRDPKRLAAAKAMAKKKLKEMSSVVNTTSKKE